MSNSVDKQLVGFKELDKKLRALGKSVGGKILRQAVSTAVTPVVQYARSNAPVGDDVHYLYKGKGKNKQKTRLVAPGFLKRSVKKKTFKSKSGRYASASVGVLREAFYGVRFLDPGTKYIQGDEWFQHSLSRNQGAVLNSLKIDLLKRIHKVAKS